MRASRRLISVFDLDHTLLKDNSSFQFGLFLYRKSYLPIWALLFIFSCNLLHLMGVLSISKLHEVAFKRLFHGRSETTVKQWVQKFLSENLEKLFYLPALERLKNAQQEGHLTAILSSSPHFLVGPIASYLNVSLWRSTKYAVDKDRCFCQISFLMLGENKASFIKKLRQRYERDKGRITAYSDSHLDLPFLLAADVAVGVNPTRKLRSICLQNHWPVI
jgi:HAD superfamily hydrolase (TIGR01490 family)